MINLIAFFINYLVKSGLVVLLILIGLSSYRWRKRLGCVFNHNQRIYDLITFITQ